MEHLKIAILRNNVLFAIYNSTPEEAEDAFETYCDRIDTVTVIKEIKQKEALQAQNARLLEAINDVWADCTRATSEPETCDAIRQETFAKIRAAIAESEQ